jgi:hypothetical protein
VNFADQCIRRGITMLKVTFRLVPFLGTDHCYRQLSEISPRVGGLRVLQGTEEAPDLADPGSVANPCSLAAGLRRRHGGAHRRGRGWPCTRRPPAPRPPPERSWRPEAAVTRHVPTSHSRHDYHARPSMVSGDEDCDCDQEEPGGNCRQDRQQRNPPCSPLAEHPPFQAMQPSLYVVGG